MRQGGYIILDLSASRVERKVIFESITKSNAPILLTEDSVHSVMVQAVEKDGGYMMDYLADGKAITIYFTSDGDYIKETKSVAERYDISGGSSTVYTILDVDKLDENKQAYINLITNFYTGNLDTIILLMKGTTALGIITDVSRYLDGLNIQYICDCNNECKPTTVNISKYYGEGYITLTGYKHQLIYNSTSNALTYAKYPIYDKNGYCELKNIPTTKTTISESQISDLKTLITNACCIYEGISYRVIPTDETTYYLTGSDKVLHLGSIDGVNSIWIDTIS